MSYNPSKYSHLFSGRGLNSTPSSNRSSTNTSGYSKTDDLWYEKYKNVSEELRKLENIHQDTDWEYKRLNNQYEKSVAENKKFLEENRELKKYHFEVQDRLKKAETENERLSEENRELKKISDRINEAQKEIRRLVEENTKLKKSGTNEGEIENLRTEIEERSTIIDETLDKNLILTKQNASLKSSYEKLNEKYQQIVAAQTKTKMENNENPCDNGNVILRLKNKIDKLTAENAYLKMGHDITTNQSNTISGNFQMKNKDNSNLEIELQNVTSKYNELTELDEILRKEHSKLKNKFQEMEKENLITINKLKDELETIKYRNIPLKLEMDNLSPIGNQKLSERNVEDESKISKLETDLRNVSLEYNDLLRHYNKLKEDYSNLEKKYKENKTKESENVNTINRLKDELQSLRIEDTHFKSKVNNKSNMVYESSQFEELSERNVEDESKISKLETDLRNVSLDDNRLKRHNKLKEDYSNLEKKYKENKTKESENVNTINRLKDELQSLRIEDTHFKSKVNNKSNMVYESSQCEEHFEGNVDESKISKLERELPNVSLDDNRLKRHYNKLKEDYSNLEKKYNENKTKESENVNTINRLKEELQSSKVENIRFKSEMDNKVKIETESLNLKDQTIDKLKKEVERIKLERDKYWKNKAELETEIEKKNDAIKRMRDKLMAAKTDNEELEALKRYKLQYLFNEKNLDETKLLLKEAKKQNEDTKEQLEKSKKDNAALNVEIKNIKLLQFGNNPPKNTRESSADEIQRIADSRFLSLNIPTSNHPLVKESSDDNNLPSWWNFHRE